MDELMKKCNQKSLAYTVCVFSLILIPTLSVICVTMPEKVLFEVYYFGSTTKIQRTTLYVTTASFLVMFFTSLLLFFGIKEGKSCYILVWILVMIVSWTTHLIISLISVSNFVIEGLEDEFWRNYAFFFVFIGQVLWLANIVFMWSYWKKMKTSNDVANLAQYLVERGKILLERRRTPPNVEELAQTQNSFATEVEVAPQEQISDS
ncbi:uncharacterized protein LOC123011721 [Tribolium madens]|uniref:uncharacterized protein LOC123011721 n=1 Tax=Tribolium madens TaxID=41895 RepID=UPI001CF72E71|nr:uncharacterized protein LOC123011721 [Tribolium madens]